MKTSSKKKLMLPRCGDRFDEYACQREKGHWGVKHWQEGVSWTDAGKARVLEERRREKEQEESISGEGQHAKK